MNKNEGFEYFVLLNANLAGYSFDSYETIDGDLKYFSERKDQYGNPIKKRYKFSKSQRVIRVPAKKKEEIEFLKNSPQCYGSPNNNGHRIMYKKLDDDGDATVAIDAIDQAVRAQAIALKLTGESLRDVAIICGAFGTSESVLKYKCLQYAQKNPDGFINIVVDVEREKGTRSLVRRGLGEKVLVKKGDMISWKDTTLGVDEDDAVANLLKDKKLREAVELAIAKSGV